MSLLVKARMKLLAFRDDTTGAATVEFVIIAPILFWFVFSTFEIGWYMTQQTMLARGLNLTIRDLRLGRDETPTYGELKQAVCVGSSVLRDCQASMHLELVPITLTSGVPTSQASCVDRADGAIQPVVSFNSGVQSDIMFVRACVVVEPLLPGVGIAAHLPVDGTGRYQLIAFSAFINEP